MDGLKEQNEVQEGEMHTNDFANILHLDCFAFSENTAKYKILYHFGLFFKEI